MVESKIDLIGIGMDLGGARRGTDSGPSAVRIAGLVNSLIKLGLEVNDQGNLLVSDGFDASVGDPKAKYLEQIVFACETLANTVQNSLDHDAFPLVIGGDHSIACGTIAGARRHLQSRDSQLGVIWFDAHTDMNTPQTTPSGNVHGMPLAACLGKGPDSLVNLAGQVPMIDPAKTVLIGVRSVDDRERNFVHETGCRVITMREIDVRGMSAVVDEAIEIATTDTAGFHLSFDLDGCDPSIAPGVGTRVPGGVNLRESHLFMELVAESEKLLSMEFCEINPIIDFGNQTAELAVELACSAFGKRILG